MKKIMFVGSVGVGKTTLTQRLKGLDISYYKTQAIQFYDAIIDTPGEFLQHRQYYNALTVTAAEADVIGLLISSAETMQTFPQGFASLFTKPVIGVVTKIDMAKDPSLIERARLQLKLAGAIRIFEISSVENIGIDDLREYLMDDDK
ncbi:EutP/PduV family microcompartment system protein [Carnobacteriaceae bacterium zg-ZUI78]|uniref:EutP/PduV family microcompartment system protein n=1 Tax=Granulicatella sp. zg-84 TaxID=2678503 RepID=UPI0013C1EF04|nr:EutP/PduV family microcompartment system protein [Granulicatella sp. zg-84]MBS4750708.1 EutP/PduV family microcompartment system protein [Carnobacteriaceae bacterium zg-ZUI78]NEW65955.1 EutP/PduV family microcompartment system protein [Granulicatella sp. zg-84]QMI85179.1 EutP/PduV family microcompartment system protein [Carnobacteriaceae bacterium zg-84]